MRNYVRARLTAIAISIGMLVCSGAFATPAIPFTITDGNSLLRMCEAALFPVENLSGVPSAAASSAALNEAYLMGFISGVMAGVAQWAAQGEVPYKIPPGVTHEQLIRIIKKWLQDHPNTLNQPASYLIFLSLKDVFPADKAR